MVVPHAAAAAVPPQGEDLPDHRHAAQCTVGKLQDLTVADFLHRREDGGSHVTLRALIKGADFRLVFPLAN